MNGRERVCAVLGGGGGRPDRPPALPIVHAGLAPVAGVSLGHFFSDAAAMAGVLTGGCRRFGYDGVQLSAGVASEAEALGALVEQPADGAPLLRSRLLERAPVASLRDRDPVGGGRMPLFFDAVRRVVGEVGGEAFVLATLRGPLLMASQLRGVEPLLMDIMDNPAAVEELLDFTTDVAWRLGCALRETGAHGLVLGEATCSPNFIAPATYRALVYPRHARLVAGLKAAGWEIVGLHICGNLLPILEDVIRTGVHFADVDYQAPAAEAIGLAGGRIALRGNLDPGRLFRFGQPEEVAAETRALGAAVGAGRWVLSSGCDIPPGTPAENLAAFAEAARRSTSD